MRFLEKVPVKVEGMVQNSYEFFIIEIKWLFSIIITRLGPWGATYPHSHPFNALTFLLRGSIVEKRDHPIHGIVDRTIDAPAFKHTNKDMHAIETFGSGAWLLTLRGPWRGTWQESKKLADDMDFNYEITTYKSGREVVKREYT